ncbi:MAG: hypothetical protein OSB76_03085 [Alphaproteobacteria bacterium]|nr:hypothetical protein [Alphaproteobacteria bacterium]
MPTSLCLHYRLFATAASRTVFVDLAEETPRPIICTISSKIVGNLQTGADDGSVFRYLVARRDN